MSLDSDSPDASRTNLSHLSDAILSNAIETLIAQIDRDQPEAETMALAGEVLREGGLVAFPTETVYGLGANAFSEPAVARIFMAKERPANDPIIVHIADLDQLPEVAIDIPDLAHELAMAFWPGALTLVLKKHRRIPGNVTAQNDTVAVRMPSHPIAHLLIEEAGVPVAAPSANRFSRPSPTSALHVLADLQGRIDIVLDAGSSDIGVESTIIDLTAATPTILRPGGVALETLREYMPNLIYTPRFIAETERAPSPGTMVKHYAPNAELLVFQGQNDEKVHDLMRRTTQQYVEQGKEVGIMTPDGEALDYEGLPVQIMLLGQNQTSMAAQLFAGLRALDAAHVDVILMRAPEQSGIGLAVWDRLLRAAQGRIIRVDE